MKTLDQMVVYILCLKIVGATLIMSFNEMKSNYGTFFHTKCELGVMLLENWSIVLHHSFADKNQDISPIDKANELVELVNQQTAL